VNSFDLSFCVLVCTLGILQTSMNEQTTKLHPLKIW